MNQEVQLGSLAIINKDRSASVKLERANMTNRHSSVSENRREFLRRGTIDFGAASTVASAALFAAEGTAARPQVSTRKPGCGYTEVINGSQYGFRVFGSTALKHHVIT